MKRYLPKPADLKRAHTNLSDYFAGLCFTPAELRLTTISTGKYVSEAKNYKNLATNKWVNGLRYVAPQVSTTNATCVRFLCRGQPLSWVGAVTFHNRRKFSELPYHLSGAGASTELEELALHNFKVRFLIAICELIVVSSSFCSENSRVAWPFLLFKTLSFHCRRCVLD